MRICQVIRSVQHQAKTRRAPTSLLPTTPPTTMTFILCTLARPNVDHFYLCQFDVLISLFHRLVFYNHGLIIEWPKLSTCPISLARSPLPATFPPASHLITRKRARSLLHPSPNSPISPPSFSPNSETITYGSKSKAAITKLLLPSSARRRNSPD